MFEKESYKYANEVYGVEGSWCTNIQEQACAIGFRAGAGIVYNEAKEIIKELLDALKDEHSDYTFALKNTHSALQQAEQFLKKEN